MSFRRMCFSTLAGLSAIGLIVAAVSAQLPVNPVPRVSQEGKIVGMVGGAIQVVTADQQTWMLQVTKDTSVMLTGTADATFLKPGTFVKFQAEVDRRQKAVRPIDAFQVFTPTKQDIPGAFPSQNFGRSTDADPKDSGKSADREAKKSDRAAKSSDRSGKKPPTREQEPATEGAGEPYDVVGRITAEQRGTLIVSYGRGSLEVEPAENAKVELALADLRFARPGDRIFFDGIVVGNEASRMLRAVTLQITRAESDEPKDKKPEAGQQPADTAKQASTKKPAEPLSPEQAEAVDEFVKLLTLKREPTNVEQFRINGDSTEFEPCARHSVKMLERRYGRPEKTEVEGTLTMRGHDRSGTWSMLRWGPIKVIVDRSQKTRFYTVEK